MALISIIIPIYNSEKYLEECLESVLQQSYKNLEVILVDDGSEDKSREICDKYAERDKRIVVIHQKNQGVSCARNVGISVAKGEFIGFVDADDIINKNLYSILYNNMIEHNADISICETNYINHLNDEMQEGHIEEINKFQVMQYIFLKDRIRGYLYNKLFKREICIQTTLREDINICEDLYYLCEIIKENSKIVYDTKELYYVRESEGSLTRTLENLFSEGGSLKYIEILESISNDFFSANNCIKDMIIIQEGRLIIGVLQKLYDIDDTNIMRKKYLKKEFERCKAKIVKSKEIKLKDKISMLLTYYFPHLKSALKKILENIQKGKY